MNGKTRWRAGLCAAVLLVLVVFLANAGTLLVVNAPERSDLIVVLAGETDRRPARALQLLDQGYGRKIVLDVPVRAKIYESTQLELAKVCAGCGGRRWTRGGEVTAKFQSFRFQS